MTASTHPDPARRRVIVRGLALGFASASILAAGTAAAREPGAGVEVIELRHRTAAEILPALEAALMGRVRLAGDGTRLIVVGDADGQATTRRLVAQFDRPLRTFRIDLRAAQRGRDDRLVVDANGRVIGTRERRQRDASIRVSEGGAAVLDAIETRTGALEFAIVAGGPRSPVRIDATHPTAQAGLRLVLTPYALGDGRVRLDVRAEDSRFVASQGLDSAGLTAATVLTLTPGEWTPIASLDETGGARETRIGEPLRIASTRSRGRHQIEARVTPLGP